MLTWWWSNLADTWLHGKAHLQGWGHSSVTDTLEYVTMLRGEYIYIHTVKWIHNTRNTNFLCSIGNISIVMILLVDIISRLHCGQEKNFLFVTSVSGMCCSPSRPKQCGFVQKRSYLPPIIAVSLFENWREPIDGWTTPRKKWSNMVNYGSSFMVERQYLPKDQQEWDGFIWLCYIITNQILLCTDC